MGQSCGKIVTFGSYRLGVNFRGGDMDALLIAPQCLDRVDFFTSFFDTLQSHPTVTDLRAIEEAYVPVMKFKFDKIELALQSIPENLAVSDIGLLKDLDFKCVKSLNGCRVAEDILNLVPDHASFRLALMTIKLWAKRKGLYSSIVGFLGGVSWAILMARVCQLYPEAAPVTLVQKFFLIFSNWKWPIPIMLRHPEDIPSADLGLPEWDPRKSLSDSLQRMPILTPTYPIRNTAFNVSVSNMEVLIREFKQGHVVCENVFSGKADWNSLFEPSDFFHRYKHYIIIQAMGGDNQEHLEWSGLVESKIRILIEKLETCLNIKCAHINPIGYSHVDKETHPYCTQWVLGLGIKKPVDPEQTVILDLTESVERFVNIVYQRAASNSKVSRSIQVKTRHVKKYELSKYISSDILEQGRRKRRRS
ncbi:hypothetical protein ACHWQZ_G000153 [Mnemiopsis leidyi]